jgi:tetraprenyl-beta-curcumene synthase
VIDDIRHALRTVLASPERLRALLRDGPATAITILTFLRRIVPRAASALAAIRHDAERIPDPLLKHEALASVDGKSYHVAGACILATYLPRAQAEHYVRIVAPLETIYDYLDNLCDRHPHVTPDAYPVLHRAIADALDPAAEPGDYYARGPIGDDGGYLRALVTRTQAELHGVPRLGELTPYFARAAELYAEMQTFKHFAPGDRERACVDWFEARRGEAADLDWHEFTCAAGSQFHVYGPLYAAFAGEPVGATYDAYFPYVCALHVLLDSFIDQAEDRATGELNFTDVYGGAASLRERFGYMNERAHDRLAALPRPRSHRFVLDVMTLFYLSHPKVAAQALDREARALLRANGGGKGS